MLTMQKEVVEAEPKPTKSANVGELLEQVAAESGGCASVGES
jgi:hypothetical protein